MYVAPATAWWDGDMMLAAWRRNPLVQRWRASTRFQDATTAGVTFAVGLGLNVIGLTDMWPGWGETPAWWHTALLAVGCAAMLFKRRHPMLALGAGTLAVVADGVLGGSIGMILVLFDLLFAAGQFASARARTAVMTAVFVAIGTASVVSGLATGEPRVSVLIGLQLTGLLVVPLWWAANLRQQRELGALNAKQAVHAERSAMARELHDVIASHLSTTAIHSGAALSLPPDTDRDRSALKAVRTSSLAALEEMRSMIMLLREDAKDTVAPSGLDQLPQLIEATGLDVDADIANGAQLPALVDHAAYRIVHEALTNARKHAPGSRVHLTIKPAGDHLELTVINQVTDPIMLDHHSLSTGTGLVSMRERAALIGGELSAGRDGDLWRVHASLPMPGARP